MSHDNLESLITLLTTNSCIKLVVNGFYLLILLTNKKITRNIIDPVNHVSNRKLISSSILKIKTARINLMRNMMRW